MVVRGAVSRFYVQITLLEDFTETANGWLKQPREWFCLNFKISRSRFSILNKSFLHVLCFVRVYFWGMGVGDAWSHTFHLSKHTFEVHLYIFCSGFSVKLLKLGACHSYWDRCRWQSCDRPLTSMLLLPTSHQTLPQQLPLQSSRSSPPSSISESSWEHGHTGESLACLKNIMLFTSISLSFLFMSLLNPV